LPDIWTEALLPDGSGLDVVDAAQVRETPVVVMSSHPESELVFTAYARGAYDCVFKPLDDTCLDELVEW
jgi:DNA-binding NtrC family response regulator